MTSERKIAANRSNAKKSTGPRTNAGRSKSRRNALRHGLAVDIRTDSAYREEIEQLANMLSRARGRRTVSDSDRDAAEAQIDLLRIRKLRAYLFETIYFAHGADPDRLAELNDKLAALERYERRAFSRRKNAFRLI